MSIQRLLVANRGEIAVRIIRAAAEMEIATIAVYSADDAASRHVQLADEAYELEGMGVAAYLDAARIVEIARRANADAVHPGYGLLSENAEFARLCEAAGIVFVGPAPQTLDLFGDKAAARRFASEAGVPVPLGTVASVSLDEARAFFDGLAGGAMMIKAIAGGGGRGMRVVRSGEELEEAYRRCRSEAQAAFGQGDVYVEELIEDASHIEVQVAGDGTGAAVHFAERDCSLQRRHQKIVEIAPSPHLLPELRQRLLDAAISMAAAASYRNIGTFEFLVSRHPERRDFWFIEANPRLQVEHTITEEIMGIDLVQLQLRLAGGATLSGLGLEQGAIGAPQGAAIQLRVNMERVTPGGEIYPSGGRLDIFDLPAGPGVRVDTFAYRGYSTNDHFDSLLAKLIVRSSSPDYGALLDKAARALAELRIAGVDTNAGLLAAVLEHPDVRAGNASTRFVDEHLAELAADAARHEAAALLPEEREASGGTARLAGPPGSVAVDSPISGIVVGVEVKVGDTVRASTQVAVVEAMKAEFPILAGMSGIVRLLGVAQGAAVEREAPILFIEPAEIGGEEASEEEAIDLDAIRPDLAEVLHRHAVNEDENRPDAVAKRRRTGQRTARENIADLCAPGSFVEYGSLALAAQRGRRSMEDLIAVSPADGLVCGMGDVNRETFPDAARSVVISYDYTVFAGTQGVVNHRKQDRMFHLAHEARLPLFFFTEGGGGRPGDTDHLAVNTLETPTFVGFARLKGRVPLVGINSGRCFAGNAALLGTCDVIIATRNSTIGMGGPAMIEGGGLGVYSPEEVGPASFQFPNGVIDVLVDDEAAAVAAARKYISYFQGSVQDWRAADQRLLRSIVPENRLRAYDMRALIALLADEGSVLELRSAFGTPLITAFIRIEGRPLGLLANDPRQLGGALDADASDKGARFIQLCDTFGIPILSLCDTPGFMVGPDAESKALVRHATRLFVAAANARVPFFTVVTRKGYGLGALAMTGGNFHEPFMMMSWPTGEFGGMGLEGSVRLGYRKELEAIADPDERQRTFDEMVARLYAHGKAVNMASFLKFDDVIDPADTRRRIVHGLDSTRAFGSDAEPRPPRLDTW